jgi:hypothetical protein
MLGRSPHAVRAGLVNNADIVVWQSSRRLMMAIGLGGAAALLRLTGVVGGPLWPILTIVPIYLGFVTLVTIVIERRHYVMRPALAALALADVAAIFTTVALVADPAFYARALLLSLLALQFTQLFFVRTPALTVVITSTIGATPTVTANIQGTIDGTSFYNIPYALVATPTTYVVTPLTITTAVTTTYLLQPTVPFQAVRVAYTANTNVTLTTTAYL